MKKWLKVLLGIVFFLLIVGLAALFIADSKYRFLRSGPLVSHETLVRPNTSVRVVIQPALAEDLIEKQLGAQSPPKWILTRVLPYEVALLLTPDLDSGRLYVDLFCNEQRLGPVIADTSATLGVDKTYPFITWSGDRLTSRSRGFLVMDGYTDIERPVLEVVHNRWGITSQLSHPRIEGSHLLEIVADNRDGSVFALLASLATKGLLALPVSLEDLADSLAVVAEARLTADLQSDNTVAIHLIVNCVPQAEPGEITATSFLIGGLVGEVAMGLKDSYGVDLVGSKKTAGTTITADYTLFPLSPLLNR